MKRWIRRVLLFEGFLPRRVLYSVAGMLEKMNDILSQQPGLPNVGNEVLLEVSGIPRCFLLSFERQTECKMSSGWLR